MFSAEGEAFGTSSVTNLTIEQELANPELAESNAKENLENLGNLLTSISPKIPDTSNAGTSATNTEINSVTGITPSTQALRYPASPNITDDTDYVLFEF